MAIHVPSVNILMSDGTEHNGVRLSIADQLQWTRTARARRWETDDQMLATIFMAWHALKRRGLTDVEWEDFETAAEWIEENDPEAELEDDERPTQTAQSAV